jgi:hypothetical protein
MPIKTQYPMLGFDANDELVKCWIEGTCGKFIGKKELDNYPTNYPVAFRSMTKRKEIQKCWDTKRDFFYIDNGYIGNAFKRKWQYRVVRNNVQHIGKVKTLPSDRWRTLLDKLPWLAYQGPKPRPKNGPILLVTPSEKPCNFYGIKRDDWIEQTVAELKNYTNREIIIRNKGLRGDRIGDNSIASTCSRLGVWSVVTYQSIAALEAVHYGIPAFTLAPNIAESVCNTNLADIEKPHYPTVHEVQNLLHYIAYCQYSPVEIQLGDAYRIIKEYGL